MDNTSAESPQRKGIYLLPNLFTTASLFAGFYAIVSAINGRFELAAIAIVIAGVLDGMDGRIARLTNTQSEFGAQYDSMSDMVSFGLAPALVVYEWALLDLGKLGWLAAFVYTACAALRLARFNTQAANVDKRYFQGLASPPAAGLMGTMVWFFSEMGWEIGLGIKILTLVLTVCAAVLMVSNVRYHSFKGFDLKGRVPFVSALIVVMVFVFISWDPSLVLFLMSVVYALSGPALTIFHLHQRRRQRRGSESI